MSCGKSRGQVQQNSDPGMEVLKIESIEMYVKSKKIVPDGQVQGHEAPGMVSTLRQHQFATKVSVSESRHFLHGVRYTDLDAWKVSLMYW